MEYTVLRSRRQTVALQITPQGQVLVRCPLRMKEADIRRFVESKAAWLQKHLPKEAPLPRFTEEEKAALKKAAQEKIPARVALFARQMGLQVGKITLRFQHTRWGSCSGKGNLNFNCLLALVPEDILDYVIVHELCHLRHMDHSRAFWQAVEDVLPDYKLRRRWLKEQGNRLIQRL